MVIAAVRTSLLARALLVASFGLISASIAQTHTRPAADSPYLFVWIGDSEHKASDFLAVIDANPASHAYGHILTTVPVRDSGTMPHHTEYRLTSNGTMLANGWAAGKTYMFDLRSPAKPTLLGSFESVAGYSFPHSFARLANGNILATFQTTNGVYVPPGGLVELDKHGKLLRSTSAADPHVDPKWIWPYSLEVDPKHDRIVTTSTPMGLPAWAKAPTGSWPADKVDAIVTHHLQVWRASDLRLLATVPLPESASGKHNGYPAEPRLLPDGSMYINTFSCGLYHLTGVDDSQPKVRFVYAFPGGEDLHSLCSVPVVIGRFWIQSVMALPGLIVLDISNPAKPVEVARLKLDAAFPMPHWVAADPSGNRLVVTGNDASYVLLVKFDQKTGKMSVDERFRDELTGQVGVNLARKQWPHGAGGAGLPHGAVFSVK